MKLVIILVILIVIAIWTAVITQLAIAKSKDNYNKKSTSDQTTTNGDKQLSKDSENIPITANEPTPVTKTTVVLPTCTDESTDPNCAPKKTISNTPDPTIQKVTPIAKTEDNSLTTISTQDNDIKDTTLRIHYDNMRYSLS